MKKLVFIKLGGSLITEKDTPMEARDSVIQHLAKEIAYIAAEPDIQLVLGNGAGSFGHYQVIQNGLKDGIPPENNAEAWYGYTVVQDAVAQLNRLVMKALLEAKVPAVSIQPSSILTANDGKPESIATESFLQALHSSLTPVVYGDIILDKKRGCSIFSTEMIFDILINAALEKNFTIDSVIHLTKVPGVLDENNRVISHISAENWNQVQSAILQTQGYDITGGMRHKIETALQYAKKGIKTIITDGREEGILSKLILDNDTNGSTVI